MKVLFICPNGESLGVEYLSACLKKAGHDTELIFDPTLFNNQADHIKPLAKIFSYDSIILKRVKKSNAGLIGFTVFYDNYYWASILAAKIKRISSIPIIFGGLHPTVSPEENISNPSVDMICIGEGEEAIVELANSMENKAIDFGIRNIWFKKEKDIIRNPLRQLTQNLDNLPFADKDLFISQYPFFKRSYALITSRGCSYSCSYCSNVTLKKLFKNKGNFIRRRSANNVITELKEAKAKYNFSQVFIFDEWLGSDEAWLEEFSYYYRREINIPFACFIFPTVNKKSISYLKFAGCKMVVAGFETVSEKTRREILNRNTPIKKIVECFKDCREAGFFIKASIIFGIPFQTDKEKRDTAKFFIENNVDMINVFWLRYYPNSEILRIAKECGWINKERRIRISRLNDRRGIIEGDSFDKKYIKLQNFISLIPILPRSIAIWILRGNIYSVLPKIPVSIVIILVRIIKFIKGKRQIRHNNYLHIHIYFIIHKLWHKSNFLKWQTIAL